MTDRIERWKMRRAKQYATSVMGDLPGSMKNMAQEIFLAGLAEGERLGYLVGYNIAMHDAFNFIYTGCGASQPARELTGYFKRKVTHSETELSALLAEGADGEEGEK